MYALLLKPVAGSFVVAGTIAVLHAYVPDPGIRSALAWGVGSMTMEAIYHMFSKRKHTVN